VSLSVKPDPDKAASRMATSPTAEVTMRVTFLAMIAGTRTKIAARIKNMPSAACRASSAPLPNIEACPGWPAAGSVTYRLTPMPRTNWTISTIRMARLARRKRAWRDAALCADGGLPSQSLSYLLTSGFLSDPGQGLGPFVAEFGWGGVGGAGELARPPHPPEPRPG
jgi:hypothetical protein